MEHRQKYSLKKLDMTKIGMTDAAAAAESMRYDFNGNVNPSK